MVDAKPSKYDVNSLKKSTFSQEEADFSVKLENKTF